MDGDDLQAHQIYRSASTAVWLAAGLVFLLSSCCVTGMAQLARVSPGQFASTVDPGGQLPAGTLPQLQAVMVPAAALLGVLTVVPAGVLLWLGFGVRQGRERALWHARWLTTALLWLAGLSTVLALPMLLSGGLAGLLNFLLNFATAGLLFRALHRVRAAQAVAAEHGEWEDEDYSDRDPWEPMSRRDWPDDEDDRH